MHHSHCPLLCCHTLQPSHAWIFPVSSQRLAKWQLARCCIYWLLFLFNVFFQGCGCGSDLHCWSTRRCQPSIFIFALTGLVIWQVSARGFVLPTVIRSCLAEDFSPAPSLRYALSTVWFILETFVFAPAAGYLA
jgi:hypothetical protein